MTQFEEEESGKTNQSRSSWFIRNQEPNPPNMNNNSDAGYINKCVKLIEARWRRGPSSEWKSYDFDKLSQEIFDTTGESLSISTLKRLFGKVSYHNLPSVYTLNALARFIGFEDWTSFKINNALGSEPNAAGVLAESTATTVPIPPPVPIKHRFRTVTNLKKRLRWWSLLILPLVALAYLFLSSTKPPRHGPVDPAAYSFRSNKVLDEGVPNSVVFHYDASAAPTDSVFIVQTWDMSRRRLVSRSDHEHSAIYYYPGAFNAKLVVDTQIVKTFSLLISSGGWLATAEGEPQPFYFKKEEYRIEGGAVVDSALLAKNHLSPFPEAPMIRISYVKDMGPLPDDNFSFETTLRTEHSAGANACEQVELAILCKNDVFIFPLTAPACIGDLQLYAQGKSVSSKEADLSGFGTDLSQWTLFKIKTVNRQMQFFINNKPVYSLAFPNAPTDIVGVQYRFRGGGAVKDTRFITEGRTIELK
jgi:hypothetical protein